MWTSKSGNTYARSDVYSDDGKRQKLVLHRFILGVGKGVHVDHVNGDGLNNTRANLRVATYSQNAYNRRVSTRNRSGVTGVSFSRQTRKWHACIQISGKTRCVGRFDTIAAAAEARRSAEKKYYGEFAPRR